MEIQRLRHANYVVRFVLNVMSHQFYVLPVTQENICIILSVEQLVPSVSMKILLPMSVRIVIFLVTGVIQMQLIVLLALITTMSQVLHVSVTVPMVLSKIPRQLSVSALGNAKPALFN